HSEREFGMRNSECGIVSGQLFANGRFCLAAGLAPRVSRRVSGAWLPPLARGGRGGRVKMFVRYASDHVGRMSESSQNARLTIFCVISPGMASPNTGVR